MLTGLMVLFSACDTIKNLPTNTSGGLFSLNGNWKLTSTTDGTAQVGTVVTIAPAIASAFVKTISNNSYCYRTSDEAWKSVSSKTNGGFTIESLASACNGNAVYKAGEITVITNSQIKISSKNSADQALLQEWTRVTN